MIVELLSPIPDATKYKGCVWILKTFRKSLNNLTLDCNVWKVITWSISSCDVCEKFITIAATARSLSQLKMKVSKIETCAVSHNVVRYVSVNSNSVGYCWHSCHTQSRYKRNNGDCRNKIDQRTNLRTLSVCTISTLIYCAYFFWSRFYNMA